MKRKRSISICCFLIPWLLQCTTRDDGPSPPLPAAEERATFVTEEDIDIHLVIAEPMIQDPVVLAFDEDGRLWVVEMRGFMPDIDGQGERNPVGRISVLEDSNGDGEMDKHLVYLDSLVMPRALAIVKGGALIVEQEALWFTSDTNSDGKADKKELIDPDYAGSQMPEHSGNGLLRGMDNWYYNAKSRFRYALRDGQWIRDSTEFRGQWGITQDDVGRLYYNYNWSQLHADLVPPNTLSRNPNHEPTSGIDYGVTLDRRVYPIRDNPAVNRGYIPGTLSDNGRLQEFTAACSPYYYRGALFPNEYHNNVYVCEPSGNLVKRNVVKHDGLYMRAFDPHPGKEFLASRDERFRPVFITAGPDGALYLADMYRGLIQHGAYVTPYLREQTLSRKLDKPVNCGRIWRIAPKGFKPTPAERLSTATTARLVELLSHPNGWYRDMAQRLLVERGDSSTPALLWPLIKDGSKPALARVHALWTLEGLRKLEPESLVALIDDAEEIIRISALRLLEPGLRESTSLQFRIARAMDKFTSGSPWEMLQTSLTAIALPASMRIPVLQNILLRADTSALLRDAVLSSAGSLELNLARSLIATADWKTSSPERHIILEMLTAAVLQERNPSRIASLLELVTPQMPWTSRAIVTAIASQGATALRNPIRLERPPATLLTAAKKVDSQGLDSTLSKTLTRVSGLFAWPGHEPDQMAQASVASLSDSDLELFALGRKHYLATCSGCHGTDGAGMKRMAPPLAGSEWVLGNEKRLALLILHGLEGSVDVAGKRYDAPEILPVMPSHSTMDDKAIRAVMTYIRNEWGNRAPAIGGRLVGKTRHTSQGRVQPWTPQELNDFIQKYPDVPDTP